MRLHRFYVSQPLGEEVVIEDGLTIKQWLKVFRYDVGDFVILFNGDGYDYTYTLTETTSASCTLLLSEKKAVILSSHKSFLFLSVIKKDLFELVAQKSVEFGITDIVPLITEHTEKKNLNTERLHTIIKEATEQCRRSDLPTLHSSVTLLDSFSFLTSRKIVPENTYITTLFGKPLLEVLTKRITSSENEPQGATAFFVGPEGGWSDNEEGLFRNNNYTRISLGDTVLRAETAGIVTSFLSKLL
jgi:16S rRNA (uracil1498-N3)-methyltransferase